MELENRKKPILVVEPNKSTIKMVKSIFTPLRLIIIIIIQLKQQVIKTSIMTKIIKCYKDNNKIIIKLKIFNEKALSNVNNN